MAYASIGRTTVSEPFRQLVKQELPGLGDNPVYWRFFQMSAFGSPIDETGAVLISADVLAAVEGRTKQQQSRNYSGIKLLQAYQRDVAPIEWREYDGLANKARVLTNNGLDKRVLDAVRAELLTRPEQLEGRCYLVDGKPFTAKRQRAARIQTRAEASEATLYRLAEIGNREVTHLVGYLNGLNSERFTKLWERRKNAAYAVADAIPKTERRERAYRVLRAIADQPQQFYAPSRAGRSVRVFGRNEGIVDLPREVRKALLQDFVSVDLACAQLAVVAALWGVSSVQRFLEDHRAAGRSIWPTLCAALGVDYNDDTKKGVKELLYGLCYGGGDKNGEALDEAATKYFGKQRAAETLQRFKGIPEIADLLQARKVASAQVKAAGGGRDIFGTWIPVEWTRRKKGKKKGEYANAASVLACQAQAVELKLLWPVVERAMSSSELDIMCWLFDGCVLAFRDRDKQERILKQLQASVAEVAAELGIATALEVEAT